MAIVTTQQITKYYEDYKATELSFTKDIIKALSMDPRQIYVKCNGSQWPCIINSSSFTAARIIIGTTGGAFKELAKKDPPPVSIKYSFYQSDGQLKSFFISGKVDPKIAQIPGKADYAMVTINYSQRPPEDFIEMIGSLLDATENSKRRKDEKVPLTPDICRKMGLPKPECIVTLQGVPRRCILKELSFGGARLVVLGLAQFILNKEVDMSLEFDEPHEVLNLKGTVVSTDPIEDRKDMVVANVQFDEAALPLTYKIHINRYISTVRKSEADQQAREDKAAVQAAIQEQRKAAVQQARQKNQAQNSANN